MGKGVRYVFSCSHYRDWTDGLTHAGLNPVHLDGVCPGCQRDRARLRAELRRLFGKAQSVVRSRKYPGGAR